MSEEGSRNIFSFLHKHTAGILRWGAVWPCLPYLGAHEGARKARPLVQSWHLCSWARCKHQILNAEEVERCLDPISPFCHTMGTPVTATLGGGGGEKFGLGLVHASSWERCWEAIHDADAGERHLGWKSYKKRHGQVLRQDCWVSTRAGGEEMQRRSRCPTRSQSLPGEKAGANSGRQGGTSEGDAGCRTRVPKAAKAPGGDGGRGCGGVCALLV